MGDNWTLDIPLRKPVGKPASIDKAETRGTVLGQPALLVTEGTSIRLKVSGFSTKEEAASACPQICFGLRYMSIQGAMPIQFNPNLQEAFVPRDPRAAAANFSKSISGANIWSEVHSIINDGSPAIYPTGQTVLMVSGGEVSIMMVGMGMPEQALRWIHDGAASLTRIEMLSDDLETAIELFNSSGFERSTRAAFIMHCAALEQIFRPQQVDERTRREIEHMEDALKSKAEEATCKDQRRMYKMLMARLGNLKRDSIARSVQEGISAILAPNDEKRRETIIEEVRAIYRVRNNLAHAGCAELGDAPLQLRKLLKEVLIAKLGVRQFDATVQPKILT